jgi:hypothetical protein
LDALGKFSDRRLVTDPGFAKIFAPTDEAAEVKVVIKKT